MKTNIIDKVYKNKYLWYSFGIPQIVFFLLFFIEEVIPFGAYSSTLYDSCHQYVPFLTEYYDKLKTGSSLQFTLSAGLGQDFWLIWSYYLSSPFNLLLLLFKRDNILLAINIITVLKIATCSLSATYYFRKKYNRIDISTLAFGLCYAFGAYVMAYFYNIMWMDVIIIFPILILCFEKMMKNEKKAVLKYCLCLAYCLLTNFYLSIPVCIFLIMYFFVFIKSVLKDFLVSGLKFAGSSLLSAGLAGIVIIPNAYYFIKGMAESTSSTGAEFKVLENFFTFMSRHLYLTDTQVDMSFKSGANVYCGTIIILLLFLYVFNTQVKLSERIKKLIVIGILFLSMNIEVLTYIWHGFDYPTGYVNRFSFIYIFMLISIGYDCYINLKKFTKFQVFGAIISNYLMIIYCYIYQGMNDEIDEYKMISYIATMVILGLYSLLMIGFKFKKIKKKMFVAATSRIIICELIFYSIFAFTSYGLANTESLYPYAENYKALGRLITDEDEYRSDIDLRKISNECVEYGLNGMSFFSSTVDSDFAGIINKLGHRAGSNFYTVKGNNNLTQMLFNLKYLYNESNYYSNCTSINTNGKIHLYENNYDTSYGYLFDTSYEDFFYDTNDNPFQLQNKLVDEATNGNVQFIYEPIPNSEIKVASAGTNFAYGSYTFNKDVTDNYYCKVAYEKQKDIIYELNIDYIATSTDDIAINIDPANAYACNVKINDSIYFSDYKTSNEMVTIGGIKEGDEITVNIKIEEDATSGNIKCYFAKYNSTQFDNFYNYITQTPIDFTKTEDGHFELNVTNSEEKTLFLSLPYLEGWSATDNGKPVEILSENYFVLLHLEPGEHNIVLKYNTPMLNYGIIISILSVIIFISLIFIKKKEKCTALAIIPGEEVKVLPIEEPENNNKKEELG